MDGVCVTVRVVFEDPFWIILFERVERKMLSVCKITVGEEPGDCDVSDLILSHYYTLRFSPAVAADVKEKPCNPKRRQREVHRQLMNGAIGTKSQQALKLQQEQMKTERKLKGKERREAEKQHQFDLKQQKKKEKHRGR